MTSSPTHDEIMRRATRCGSYPFRYIAEDFGVDYGDVIARADDRRPEVKAISPTYWAATDRLMETLGPSRMAQLDKAISDAVPSHWIKDIPF